MSYDVSLYVRSGDHAETCVFDWNFTRNVSIMWREAGADIATFHGKTAGECAPILGAAIEVLKADPERFKKYDAPNKWGTYD